MNERTSEGGLRTGNPDEVPAISSEVRSFNVYMAKIDGEDNPESNPGRYHQVIGHPSNACGTLRNAIQDLADGQVLTFKEGGFPHVVNAFYCISKGVDAKVPHHTAAMNQEVPRSQRITYTHCHVTDAQTVELENSPRKEVLHTRSGRDFAKDYSKSLMERIGRPQEDKEIAAPQKEGFRYDIIDHLSCVPAKVSLLDLIGIDKNVRMSLLEALAEQRKQGLGPTSVDYLATRLKESIPITFD
ncbi:hypothetical protein AAC387_Pa03g1912 [Persea americana]